MDEYREIEDTNLVAFLHYKGYDFVPFKKTSKRVSFRVYGEIGDALEGFFRNESVPIQNFVMSLKAVRSSMFTFRNIKENMEE
jgi:hypothetical protein